LQALLDATRDKPTNNGTHNLPKVHFTEGDGIARSTTYRRKQVHAGRTE
jgi:hypothetical protein